MREWENAIGATDDELPRMSAYIEHECMINDSNWFNGMKMRIGLRPCKCAQYNEKENEVRREWERGDEDSSICWIIAGKQQLQQPTTNNQLHQIYQAEKMIHSKIIFYSYVNLFYHSLHMHEETVK